MYPGSYDSLLVLLSFMVAVMAAYTTLDMARRLATMRGRAVRWWLAGGAVAMGLGTWSMHFVGMLAFSLPVPLGYDPLVTLLALAIGIGAAGLALWVVAQPVVPPLRLALGALAMGASIAGTHYMGMAAMRMDPAIEYGRWQVVLSVAIAIVASGIALWMTFHLVQRVLYPRLVKFAASLLMAAAIAGMHYTGMSAAHFRVGSVCGAVSSVTSNWLALSIIVVTVAVLAISLVASIFDVRLETRTAALAASLAEANRELTYLALHDNLTKLPNRRLLEDRLDQAISSARRGGRRFSLMFLDLDGFKAINDAFGHHVGDMLLVGVADRLKRIVRDQDTVARLGGDEFILLFDITEPTDAATVAERIVVAVREAFEIANHRLRVSASVGIVVYPENGDQARTLLANADAAMYHSKALGRNCYCFFEDSMNANVREQLELIQDLRESVDRQELVLHYQPKVVAPAGPVIGAEALLRWQHPTRGLLLPDKFIHLAEKSGLIVPIGEWVLNEACRQARVWRDAGWRDWTMAVNVSSLQFSNAGLIPSVRTALARHELPPDALVLEITEMTAMRNVDDSRTVLEELTAMGVRISIDDFGTGYSSLLHLKRLPATELKIDRGFVRDLEHDSEDAAIVSAIVALGRTLNLTIVAEGVETNAQQTLLTRLGCSFLQGFLLGHPVPAEDFAHGTPTQGA
ncbi:putative bifunctional diguanylate cyclase/phosphodiesterase [Chitinasiproducens palmae]|uniref:Diguanylate cyclase (GGDEF) domain-containing protein n=1 Tax=Chitinasiproducens palmae TaxID=1770053 RepID=A0A1H2PNX7_9BURK|nr:EAL domain-containing protein [Chitinasiproducens palmae]SDV48426.1 diguanylate cyclase (GGDEF) domain-containing protein [Chitinasiproducens palmae]